MLALIRNMPRGSVAARGAQRARALIDGETDDGVPFGWFVHGEEASDETFQAAVLPYLDPPNRMWWYRTTEDADFLDMGDVRTVNAVHARLVTVADKKLLASAFPMQGGVVRRYSDADNDNALVRAMVHAGILHESMRGWTHSSMTRPDGGIHRRETVALHPSKLLRTARSSSPTSSPRSPGRPRSPSTPRSPRSPGTPRSPRSPKRATPRSGNSTPKRAARRGRSSSPQGSPA